MPGKSVQTSGTLSPGELNRAVLARQMLLRRERIGVVEAIERLAGMQAQYSPSPYIGLWTRLEDFRHEKLTDALTARQVVKATLMRVTLHLASARDYPILDRALAEARVATWSKYAAELGLNVPELHGKLFDYVREPRTFEEMLEHIGDVPMPPGGEPDPERRRRIAWRAATAAGGILQALPAGTWRYFGKNSYISARTWLGDYEQPPFEEALTFLVRRYLAAFGPATRSDIVQWSGLRKVGDVDKGLQALGDEVVAFRSEANANAVLYDLAGSPRPPAETVAPPRFLPKWDNLLLAYESRDRERVLPREYHKTVIRVNGDVLPTILVDGKVAGAWSVVRKGKVATLSVEPFQEISSLSRKGLEEEGERLVRFYEPDAETYEIRFALRNY
ncbi:MAG TPA: winged helix DNA-binding domain-containing protein [Chloroflexia bacterium]